MGTRSKHCCRRAGRSRRPSDSARTRSITDASVYDEAERDWQGFWATPGARARLDRGVAHDPRVGPAVRASGSSAASSTSRTTASTATSRPATATRSRSTGRVSPATRARSPTASCSRSRAASPTCCESLGVAEGRPRRDLHGHGARDSRPRCSRARASARRTRSCSAASPPRRCAIASTTPRPRCSSPPTARGGAAPSSR